MGGCGRCLGAPHIRHKVGVHVRHHFRLISSTAAKASFANPSAALPQEVQRTRRVTTSIKTYTNNTLTDIVTLQPYESHSGVGSAAQASLSSSVALLVDGDEDDGFQVEGMIFLSSSYVGGPPGSTDAVIDA